VSKAEYEALAEFRYALRQFVAFSEQAARSVGLTARQHQAMLVIRGFPDGEAVTVGHLGEQLQIQSNSAVGLVNRLAAPEELAEETQRFARSIADQAPVTVRLIKRATYQSADVDLRTALDLISSHFAVVAATEDAAEALAALKEKRPPNYIGR